MHPTACHRHHTAGNMRPLQHATWNRHGAKLATCGVPHLYPMFMSTAHTVAHSRHISTSTGLATSVSDVAVHFPYWAHPCHIHTRTRLACATSAPGLCSPLQHLRQGWAPPAHTCAGTLSTLPTCCCRVLGVPRVLNHASSWLCRFWEKILPALNTRTASTILAQLTDRSSAPSTAPGLGSPLPTSAPGFQRSPSRAGRAMRVRCSTAATPTVGGRSRTHSAALGHRAAPNGPMRHCAAHEPSVLCLFASVLRAEQFSSRSR
jgi:hypothetical protein